jgi:large subunit ribosomal protein L6
MSRIGKYPVTVPSGVTVQLSGQQFTAKGKLGQLGVKIDDDVDAKVEEDRVVLQPRSTSKRARAMWGTTRSLVQNAVTGVSEGFTVNLEINGVGYRAAVQGKTLNLQLGFSHEVAFAIPEGITIKAERPNFISIHGADRRAVGQLAAEIRGKRPPEPYKGKGVKYEQEQILRKEGKKK